MDTHFALLAQRAADRAAAARKCAEDAAYLDAAARAHFGLPDRHGGGTKPAGPLTRLIRRLWLDRCGAAPIEYGAIAFAVFGLMRLA